ncbi:hypothetical protein JM946_09165 [Steroidobacter sp. S1-65]|uniref:Extradiol ring-cleavage dioxygenase LigAB LigA subunit domain-containing protein n=1 Tax=Steroidobacter gossypii TaxID=2805490 RepID=A0ABS1WVD4_9GAMM|nr:hypothetical protein [Steroidobacter gossypii]MBM0104918.1 hypothetical protein [Steroidobacter gossypii]
MSRSGLEGFLFRFDKEPARQEAFKANDASCFDGFDLDQRERDVLIARDVATLYEWGLHPLLIRNFAGTLGVKYVLEYRKRGLQ